MRSFIPLRGLPFGWLGWKRRENRDALIIFGVGILGFILADFFDLPPLLLQFGLDHADWEVDDAIFVTLLLSAAMLVYGFRRYRDLAHENRARVVAELEAQNLARRDVLTALPNRRFFDEKLGECIENAGEQARFALLLLDLDGFKQINDTSGHAVGDRTLCEFARRVSTLLPASAFLARLGGDEFAIIMPAISVRDEAACLARTIREALSEPFVTCRLMAKLGVSIGIVVAPDDAKLADDLLRKADRALYLAKTDGRSSFRFYEADMEAPFERRKRVERELRNALNTDPDSIACHYQPVISLDDNRVVGFEMLSRWHSEALGPVPPDLFIPIAEQTGLITSLADRLLRRACCDARNWPADLTLSFNVSAVQLRDPAFGLRLLSILGETGFSPRRLEIEITETALVENVETARTTVEQLRGAGIRIAIDDFGTGYATLTQLLSFRVDKIKIDKSFVARLGHGNGGVIVRAILGLAKGFGLNTTAEGIEDAGQLSYLRCNGCTEGQGYLFGKAMPASDVAEFLLRWTSQHAIVGARRA
jgi:diguanylate cyclase (GGDEF)-like protein